MNLRATSEFPPATFEAFASNRGATIRSACGNVPDRRGAGNPNTGEGKMDKFAVSVLPLVKPQEWLKFADSIAHGERADAHRAMLARLGVTHEYVHRQTGHGSDLVVLVWEGVDQHEVAAKMGDLAKHPQSEHERYVVEHVIGDMHGVDVTAGPPPELTRVADIDSGRVPATH